MQALKMFSILHFVVVRSQLPLCLNTNTARQFVVLVVAAVVRNERETVGVDGGAEHGGVVIHSLCTDCRLQVPDGAGVLVLGLTRLEYL